MLTDTISLVQLLKWIWDTTRSINLQERLLAERLLMTSLLNIMQSDY